MSSEQTSAPGKSGMIRSSSRVAAVNRVKATGSQSGSANNSRNSSPQPGYTSTGGGVVCVGFECQRPAFKILLSIPDNFAKVTP